MPLRCARSVPPDACALITPKIGGRRDGTGGFMWTVVPCHLVIGMRRQPPRRRIAIHARQKQGIRIGFEHPPIGRIHRRPILRFARLRPGEIDRKRHEPHTCAGSELNLLAECTWRTSEQGIRLSRPIEGNRDPGRVRPRAEADAIVMAEMDQEVRNVIDVKVRPFPIRRSVERNVQTRRSVVSAARLNADRRNIVGRARRPKRPITVERRCRGGCKIALNQRPLLLLVQIDQRQIIQPDITRLRPNRRCNVPDDGASPSATKSNEIVLPATATGSARAPGAEKDACPDRLVVDENAGSSIMRIDRRSAPRTVAAVIKSNQAMTKDRGMRRST